MTIYFLLVVIRRWWWLMVAITLLTAVVLSIRLKPGYTSQVTIQVTQPPSEQVSLFDQAAPYSDLRDELTVARNGFMEAARSARVRNQTTESLHLSGTERDYALTVAEVRDSGLVTISVEAPTAATAQSIADAHALLSIQEAGRLRALPAMATKQLLSDRLATAQTTLDTAVRAAAEKSAPDTQAAVTQARTDYAAWQKKLNEAQLKSDTSYAASFMQVVTPATLPLQPATQKIAAQLLMGSIGALVVSFLLSIVLDVVTRRLSPVRPLVVRQGAQSGIAPL